MPQSPRVLIVDDEPEIRRLIEEELVPRGFECRTAGDASQAKEFLRTEPFGVLITDISMPDAGGFDLLAHVRQHAPDCKVILLTGMPAKDYLARALALGAYEFMEKPLDMARLVEAVSNAHNGADGAPTLSVRAAQAMRLGAKVRGASLDSVRALVRAVEMKDPYTVRHSEHVAGYAAHLAAALGEGDAFVERTRTAALLHDVGMIGVPDGIIGKPEPLTPEERACVQQHPLLGGDILANIVMLEHEALLVRYHHEYWDGTGYPDGLSGEEIPLSSRIIRVADSIDAMLMDRAARKGLSVEKMLDELVRCAGTQFDPRIVPIAVRWCRENPDKLTLPQQEPAPAGTPGET